jgi:hypothetical protein
MPKGKDKIIKEIQEFIKHKRQKAIKNLYDYHDDLECYKMIYALAECFRVDENHKRNNEKVEIMIDDLWILYYYFKNNIDGKKTNYNNIVNKFSNYEKTN